MAAKKKSWGYKKSWVKPAVEKVEIDFSEVENQMTEYHRIIRDAISEGKNGIISAGPGTGKTWTISRVVIPTLEKIGKINGMVFAFTNKNAQDFEKCILSDGIKTGTYHKLLGKIVTEKFGKYKRNFYNVEDKFDKARKPGKTMEMAKGIFEGVKASELVKICNLTNMAKMAAFGIGENPSIENRKAWEELAERFSINSGDEFEGSNSVDIIECAQKLFVQTIKNTECIDFADMPYFVLYYDLPLPELDFVVMDEAQDIPQILLEFMAKCHENGAQILAVGDKNQSINDFAGAINEALSSIISRVNGTKLDLKVSYRVSIAAAGLCNQIFPDSVIPWDGAKQGSISNITFEEFKELLPDFSGNDAALSRTHKNLIPLAMEFIRKGIPFVYKGIREWVEKARKSLFMASKKANSTEFYAISMAMDDFLRGKEDENAHRPKMPRWIVEMSETISILNSLIQGIQEIGGNYKTLLGYLDTLEKADNNTTGLPTLSTIHASKGGEWANVYIIGSCISPLAKTERELAAEKCCEYVAYSRSSDRIIFVPAEK
jgi:hypothetical protein